MSPYPAKVKKGNLYIVTLGSAVRVDGITKWWWKSQQPGYITLVCHWESIFHKQLALYEPHNSPHIYHLCPMPREPKHHLQPTKINLGPPEVKGGNPLVLCGQGSSFKSDTYHFMLFREWTLTHLYFQRVPSDIKESLKHLSFLGDISFQETQIYYNSLKEGYRH